MNSLPSRTRRHGKTVFRLLRTPHSSRMPYMPQARISPSTRRKAQMSRYPSLPNHLREALGGIVPSGDDESWYFPCSVTLERFHNSCALFSPAKGGFFLRKSHFRAVLPGYSNCGTAVRDGRIIDTVYIEPEMPYLRWCTSSAAGYLQRNQNGCALSCVVQRRHGDISDTDPPPRVIRRLAFIDTDQRIAVSGFSATLPRSCCGFRRQVFSGSFGIGALLAARASTESQRPSHSAPAAPLKGTTAVCHTSTCAA